MNVLYDLKNILENIETLTKYPELHRSIRNSVKKKKNPYPVVMSGKEFKIFYGIIGYIKKKVTTSTILFLE